MLARCSAIGPRLRLLASGHAPPPHIFNSLKEDTPSARSLVTASRPAGVGQARDDVATAMALNHMVRAFRWRGHFVADLDPLGLNPRASPHAWRLTQLLRDYPRLDLSAFGLEHLGEHEPLPLRILHRTAPDGGEWTLHKLVSFLRESYAGTLGVELSHVTDDAQERWLIDQVESWPEQRAHFSNAARLHVLKQLVEAELFEHIVGKRFPAAKRFGIEGVESLIPGMNSLLFHSSHAGVQSVYLGMAHRGRLNVLANALHKPLGALFSEFQTGRSNLQAGDVKYHLGTTVLLGVDQTFERGTGRLADHDSSLSRDGTGVGPHATWPRPLRVNLAPNPSHLEAVSPVVVGAVRAEQQFTNDWARSRTMGLLIHGDAAFSGQGVVAETLELSDLPEYTTGGTVHLVMNNQIGFTTDPRRARSSPYPSDVAKGVGAPIFHVNGDDPEAVVRACRLCAEWRATFNKDVVLDLICYRRQGHNELDDPRPTQPIMYQRIDSLPTTVDRYAKQLAQRGVIGEEEAGALREGVARRISSEFSMTQQYHVSPLDWVRTNWQGEALSTLISQRSVNPTGVPLDTLRRIGRAMTEVPHEFAAHPEVVKLLQQRRRMCEDQHGVDWACAEALAIGSLMIRMPAGLPAGADVRYETHPPVDVRLSGQDVERGTFNQRHAVLFDQRSEARYVPLNHLAPGEQAELRVCNSNLSELAVLGFEYGFSLENPNALVLWEAQFGDFVNNAQAVVDSFVASGEAKWGAESNLVMLLPHGQEGQGPDHSSGYMERFLQLMNDDADNLPGLSPEDRAQIEEGFQAVAKSGQDEVTHDQIIESMQTALPRAAEKTTVVLQELARRRGGRATVHRDEWSSFMVSYLRRNSERQANMCVVNCTTPANYFHVLRRQIHRPFNKPLVVMSPKSLLHHRPCRSALADMGPGTNFRRVIEDEELLGCEEEQKRTRRVLLCSGKIYYQLAQRRRARKRWDVALVRLEQVAPFPHDHLAFELNKFPKAEVVWVQEEPKNRGAWDYVQPRLNTVLRWLCQTHRRPSERVAYVGRAPSAVAATGSFVVHNSEQRDLIAQALG